MTVLNMYYHLYNCDNSCTLKLNNDDLRNYLNVLRICKRFSHIRNKCHTIFSYTPWQDLY